MIQEETSQYLYSMDFKIKKTHYLFTLVVLSFGLSTAQENNVLEFDSNDFNNFYKINDSLYRSNQPSKKAFKELEIYGFKTIINFRRFINDNRKARDTKLKLVHLPLQTAKVTETDIIEALTIIKESQKPILIHCWHGSDRTGVVIASYRIVFENWTKEKAIAEFRKKEFGYHEKWYPNLISILEKLNVGAIRKQLILE